MKLTDKKCRNARPNGKPYKLADGHGLYLFVSANGKRLAPCYRFEGKRQTMSFGVYPEVGFPPGLFSRRRHEAMIDHLHKPLVTPAEIFLHRRNGGKSFARKRHGQPVEAIYKSAFTTSRKSVARGRPIRFAGGIDGNQRPLSIRHVACATRAIPLIAGVRVRGAELVIGAVRLGDRDGDARSRRREPGPAGSVAPSACMSLRRSRRSYKPETVVSITSNAPNCK